MLSMHWLLENQSEQDNLSLFSVSVWELVTASSYSFPFLASFMEESSKLNSCISASVWSLTCCHPGFPLPFNKMYLGRWPRTSWCTNSMEALSPYLIWPFYDSYHSILRSTSLFPWFGGTTLSWCLIFRLLHWLLLHPGIFNVLQGSNP